MARIARVESVEALKHLRAALVKFAYEVRSALGSAETTVSRARSWVDDEQKNYWQQQKRQRHDALQKAMEALRAKELYQRPDGTRQSADEEEKAVKIAERRLEEAEEKLKFVRHWSTYLEREQQLFRGQINGLATAGESDVPRAAADLERMIISLETYLAEAAVSADQESSALLGAASMARGSAADITKAPVRPEHLRDRTATATIRDQLSITALDKTEAFAIDPADRAQISQASLACKKAKMKSKIVLERGALAETDIFLHRLESNAPDDSGWFIGAVDIEHEGVADQLSAAKMGDVFKGHPDLAGVLELAPGHLVLIRDKRIVCVVDDEDEFVWSNESI